MSGLAVKKEMRGPVNMVAALSHGLPTILNFTKSFSVEVVVWKTQNSQNKRKIYPNLRVLNRSCTYLSVNSAFAGPEPAIFNRLVAMAMRCEQARGVWGHAPPGKFLKLGTLRWLLRPSLGQNATRITPPVISVAGEAIEPSCQK